MADFLTPSNIGSYVASTLLAEQDFHNLVRDSKEDVRRVLDILEHVGSSAPEMQKTRTDVLRQALETLEP